jgi:hypothetical protein
MNSKSLIRIAANLALCAPLAVGLAACRKGVDLGSDPQSPAATSSPQTDAPAVATPNPSAATSATPSTPAKPGPPGEVPEMMKRAFTKEEMDKAIDQLPPEVRSRLKGMSYLPTEAKPAPPVKPSPTPTSRPK